MSERYYYWTHRAQEGQVSEGHYYWTHRAQRAMCLKVIPTKVITAWDTLSFTPGIICQCQIYI